MIRDLSKTLENILTQQGLPRELSTARIDFTRPSEPYNPPQATVNMYLYEIRENVELRTSDPVVMERNGQAVIHRPPLRVACSYLITAWPRGGQELALQEHRLLSQVLQVLSRYPTIPDRFLVDKLKGQEPPLPMIVAQADGIKNPAEFWSALGNKLRPSITATVTMAMDIFEPETVPVVVTGDMVFIGDEHLEDVLSNKRKAAVQEEFCIIRGRITGAGNAPVAKAAVTLVEIGLTIRTGEDGYYIFDMVTPGNYTLHVKSDAGEKDASIRVPATDIDDYNMQL